MPWLFLGIAITGEVIGTTALKASHGFTRLGYGGLALLSYAVSFYFLAIILKTIPIGVAYAIWSGARRYAGDLHRRCRAGPETGFLCVCRYWIDCCLGVLVLNLLSATSTH